MNLSVAACLLSLLATWTRRAAGEPRQDLEGPGWASGPRRGRLSVQCHYKQGWEPYVKYWCKGANWRSCTSVVQTGGDEQVKTTDRVSIRDNQYRRVFTVTVENLQPSDADTYWCAIQKSWTDLGDSVNVMVGPERTTVSITTTIVTTTLPEPETSPWSETSVTLPQSEPSTALSRSEPSMAMSQSELSKMGFPSRSLFIKLPSLFLLLLKIPLLLSLLCALVWERWHRKDS